jgi:hypothetical protein
MSGEKQGSRAAKPLELNNERARRAARHPDRPGEKCGADPGAFHPAINRNSCEGSVIASRSVPMKFSRFGESTIKISPNFRSSEN